MRVSLFQNRDPQVDDASLRIPQREAYRSLEDLAKQPDMPREVGIILPVGCGKSGCIALAPFAIKAKRALVVAPGLTIAEQLSHDFDPANPGMFYTKTGILSQPPYPEPVEIRGTTTNVADLEEADVVITNIQQLQGRGNRWLDALPPDYFDLILFDEGHHNVASSWETLRTHFPDAKIVSLSATPLRADGQLMTGRIIYSYPVARAIQDGYVKRLKAIVLNPRTLRYVRRADGAEITVSLDEVRRLGEEDADFRRSIVSSEETLNTIVDASIRELQKLRERTGLRTLKIIASALNYNHCRQIVEAYRARGQRADYVHSREESAANKRVLTKLDSHELDVIVQVRKLGEGFDHPHLAVAAVFSIFSNLSPFVQFVGRIMRVIKQNAPGDLANYGTVIFHAGANIARQWSDFRQYSEADQEYFDQLLPLEDLNFESADELEIVPEPRIGRASPGVEVRGQEGVVLQEIPLIADDPEALAALELLRERGYTSQEVAEAFEELDPVPVTKVRQRQAKRASLDMRVRTEAARVLRERGINPEGHEFDRQRIGRSNLVTLKTAIDREVNASVGRGERERHEFTREQLEYIDQHFTEILERGVAKTLDG